MQIILTSPEMNICLFLLRRRRRRRIFCALLSEDVLSNTTFFFPSRIKTSTEHCRTRLQFTIRTGGLPSASPECFFLSSNQLDRTFYTVQHMSFYKHTRFHRNHHVFPLIPNFFTKGRLGQKAVLFRQFLNFSSLCSTLCRL